ncbi:unnamed protein product [Bursaphelenchus okinawaensis]|uniref:Two pore potassium channel protein sup-9 n=1 Tax=Bursaphelenchus okinawaensis TaxID=465554 RepID=A0A811K9E4_9BILA|nr:unnamed protein product [Bursaphelenchus okinawaensis]CAG9094885.1 unnamed protein product [Bursaphelenchus okinawaensis]
MKRQNVRTLSLIVCTLTYLLVGAAVFDALESEHELKLRSQVERTRERLIHKYNISKADYDILESIIIKSIPHKAGHQWKFSGAFYFAMTVITTIGYGHSTPMTVGGKTFCMLYALAGIPLGLVMFQAIGERLNTFVASVLKEMKKCFGREQKVTHIDLILICTTLSLMIIFSGAFVFHRYENWTYFDSIYYCFTSLVTVGFGDYVALQKHGALQNQPEYVLFSVVFIVSGLTVISAAMNLLVLRFLTLNTEDEKRDQREQKLAERGFVSIRSLDGRRKYSNSLSNSSDDSLNSSPTRRRRLALPKTADADTISVCSCSCYQVPYNRVMSKRDGSKRSSRKRRSSRKKQPNPESPLAIPSQEFRRRPSKPVDDKPVTFE